MFRRRFAENFFIIVLAMLSDRSRTSDVKPFRFRNFQPHNEFFYLDALARAIAIFPIRRRECSPRNHALQRMHCFNSQ